MNSKLTSGDGTGSSSSCSTGLANCNSGSGLLVRTEADWMSLLGIDTGGTIPVVPNKEGVVTVVPNKEGVVTVVPNKGVVMVVPNKEGVVMVVPNNEGTVVTGTKFPVSTPLDTLVGGATGGANDEAIPVNRLRVTAVVANDAVAVDTVANEAVVVDTVVNEAVAVDTVVNEVVAVLKVVGNRVLNDRVDNTGVLVVERGGGGNLVAPIAVLRDDTVVGIGPNNEPPPVDCTPVVIGSLN